MFAKKPSTSPHSFLFLVVFALLFFAPVVTSVAQIDPVRTSPTQAPTATMGALQANPTQPPEPDPIDDIQANPTNTPTPRPPDGPDDAVANPTEAPEREIDDVVANPTDAPGVDDVEVNPTTGTVRVIKRDCPLGVVEDAFLSDYLAICTQQHNGVEFVLNDVDGAQAGTTTGGQVEWTGVDPGVFEIVETLPSGYGDPIVFCGYAESPGGGIQHPSLQTSTGGLVSGSFPDRLFEYGCYWMNIPTETGFGGPDSVANPEDFSNTLVTRKWICPGGIAGGQSLGSYMDECELVDFPVEFTLTNDDGVATVATSAGKAVWNDVPLGPFTIQEAIPAGYGEPIAFCGWTAFYQGAVYDAFLQLVPSPGGLVEGEISVPNTFFFCHFFNAEREIDDVQANPTNPPETVIDDFRANPVPASLSISLAECRSDSIPGDDIYSEDVEFFSEWCDIFTTEFEFTVSSEGGFTESQTTSSFGLSFAEVPVAPITITETIPIGWDEPMALCWSDQVDPAGWQIGNDVAWNVASGEQIECLWVNVTGSVAPFFRANAKVCPAGFDTNVAWVEVFSGCNTPINGVAFTFTDASGSSTQPLTGQFVQWNQTGIGDGQTVELVEDFPAGYTDPLVLCSSWPTAAGDPFDWNYEPVEPVGGAISVTPNLDGGQGPLGVIQASIGYDCKFFHFAVEEIDGFQANPTEASETVIDDVVANPTEAPETVIDDLHANPAAPGTLTVRKWVCPAFYDPLVGSPLADCTESLDGVTFELDNHDPGQPDLQAVTGDVIGGAAVFEPEPGTYSLLEQIPDGYEQPFLWDCTGLDNPAVMAPPISTINFFRIVIGAGQDIECDWMNVIDNDNHIVIVL